MFSIINPRYFVAHRTLKNFFAKMTIGYSASSVADYRKFVILTMYSSYYVKSF
jgi:hypothetical protein